MSEPIKDKLEAMRVISEACAAINKLKPEIVRLRQWLGGDRVLETLADEEVAWSWVLSVGQHLNEAEAMLDRAANRIGRTGR